MHCQKCGDTFKVIQMVSNAFSYKQALPRPDIDKNKKSKSSDKITLKEIDRVRKQMEETNPLKTLFEGQKPGAPFQATDD